MSNSIKRHDCNNQYSHVNRMGLMHAARSHDNVSAGWGHSRLQPSALGATRSSGLGRDLLGHRAEEKMTEQRALEGKSTPAKT